MKCIKTCLKLSIFCILTYNIIYASNVINNTTKSNTTNNFTKKNNIDLYMLKAADLANQGKFIEASKIYQNLYKDTKDFYFLKQVAITQSQSGNLDNALKTAKKYQEISKNIDDIDTNLIIAEDHVRKKEYNFAIILLEKISSTNPTLQIHYLLSNLYIQQNMPNKALKHLISIYNDEMSIGTKLKLESLNQIIAIYFQENKIDDALKYLNEYISSNEYNINLQNFFAIYKKTNRLDMLKENLKKRFLEDQTIDNANFLVSVLIKTNSHNEAIEFLKEYENSLDSDGEELLMQVYVDNKEFNKALELAKKLYENTNRIDFLALSAIYEYETIKNKDENNLKPIVLTLQSVLQQRTEELTKKNQNLTKDDAFFYNFLGYLMINHNINIDDGMKYVSKALAIEPNSIEYLDSLAWGFYKKGDCKNAKETFNLIPKQKINTIQELIEHNEIISKCKK